MLRRLRLLHDITESPDVCTRSEALTLPWRVIPYIKHGSETARRLAHGKTIRDSKQNELERSPCGLCQPARTKPINRRTDVEIELPIPDYDERLTATSRDPSGDCRGVSRRGHTAAGFHPGCAYVPKLSARCNDSEFGCQDLFGTNMRPVGGVLGGMSAFGGGTEHQGHGTPHLHAEGHAVCVHQYGTLQEVAEKISHGFLNVKNFTTYNDWLHHTDVFDEEQHSEFRERVDEEFDKRFAGRQHDAMCTTPAYLADDASSDPRATLADVHAGTTELGTLETEGTVYRICISARRPCMSSVASSTTCTGGRTHGYVPLSNCAKKTKKNRQRDRVQGRFSNEETLHRCTPFARVGAWRKKLGLRRLWQTQCPREGPSGGGVASGRVELHLLLLCFSVQTPIQLANYRVPLMAKTHDDEVCPSKTCAAWVRDPKTSKILSKLAQRAQREATGYHCGYTFKRQPVGTKYLRTIGESLNYMTVAMQDKTSAQKRHRITHRILMGFQHRIVARTAPEEWNLASRWHDQDPTVAEFMRTYMSVAFPGGQLVQRLEMKEKQLEQREWQKVLPTAHGRGSGPEDLLKHFPDFYGHRWQSPSRLLSQPLGVPHALGCPAASTAQDND